MKYLNEVCNMAWEDAICEIPENSIDLVLTDPPYGMNYQSGMRKKKYKPIQNDNNLDWLPNWVAELKRVCKPDAHLYIFCSWHKIDVFKQEISKLFKIKNTLIWEKSQGGGMGDLEGDYAPKYEMILFCSNGSKKLNGRRDSNILRAKRTKNENHPTEKPTQLLRYLIEKSSKKGDIVLDTFAGSFSTAQACVETGRDFISFEIDADYCQKAKELLKGVSLSLF